MEIISIHSKSGLALAMPVLNTAHTTAQEAIIMTANTTAQKINQANVMASTGTKVSDQVNAFDRYLAMVAGQVCTHPNGHITTDAATRCGLAMAEMELASLPANVDMEAKLTAVAVTLVTQPRFQCVKGCPFGHKTQAQATSCSSGSQASAAKAVKASIPVSIGGSLASFKAQTLAQAPKPTQAPVSSTQAPAKPKLKSGAQGTTGKA